ncbi:ATP synthase F1 subunit delta [Vampirovibrio chlorellavorus]|uniref:ATP synthase F1 subunit delta n=1 Tax=Vampirovibrio chlorellavorus TaxID=758823 RepID=UPI0026E997AC|nr:ATP synthase F1 subunit delta [Vampirovibrio chlorellavorus]
MSNRLENNKVASRYAKALFESVQESGEVDRVHEDLRTVSDLLSQVPELAAFLENPGVPQADKQQFIDEQFGPKVTVWIHRLLKLLVDNHRAGVIPALVDQFSEFRNQAENSTSAEVITAVELEEELRNRIQKTLESTMGFSRVDLHNRVEPGLLGGAIIKIQDQVIDGSYVGRLEALRKQVQTL